MEKFLLDYDWTVLAPELTIAGAAALLSIIDLVLKPNRGRHILAWMALAAVAAAGYFTAIRLGAPPYEILADTYRVDDFARAFKLILLTGTGLVFLISFREFREEKGFAQGEYYYLLLTALLGGMVMTSSADLITLFVGLELLSISSYILAGIRRRHGESSEAAWKYVVMGGVSSAFILYGMSFLYGLAGSTNLFTLRERLAEAYNNGYESFILLSFFCMLLGFGFKVASAPFHMWAPDVYQGSPTPVAAFLAVVSKSAAFAFILRIFLIAFLFLYQVGPGKETVGWGLWIVASLSMVIGNSVALKQLRTKRLLAYSSVAHGGYLLVPLAALGPTLFESTLYYLLAYLFMTLGAFTVVMVVERESGKGDLSAFAGLSRRSPFAAAGMALFLVSLAGIPVTAGFFGKFYILINTVTSGSADNPGPYWLAAIMLGTTVVSYFYYFGIIRMMYFRPPQMEGKLRVSVGPAWVIGIAVLGTLALGFMPQWVLDFLGTLDWVSAISPLKQGPVGQ
ncbi:NADH-quinone oxidoreductase subunit N [Salinithrix halophila]|uniref:NADH-quinone oxidoreductase subunit N n=1 Tax=Salinithrix halophila TaxID=1485204 RepID=A0ABV8JHI7_9BACL